MKTKLLFLSVLFFTFCGSFAQVTLPFYDGLNYTVGTTLINSGTNTGFGSWVIPSFQSAGSTSDPLLVTSPTWTLPANLPASTGNAIEFVGGGDDPVITIPNQGSTGIIYSSFMLKITDQTATSTTSPGYIYSFAKVSSSGTSLNYTSCVYVSKLSDTTFNLGISENNNTTNAVWDTATFTTNTDIFVVIAYDVDNAVSTMWLNPVVNGTQPSTTLITNETATSTRTDLTMVRLSLESNSKTPTVQLDEVRIGNTWNDVAPSSTAGIATNELNNIVLYPNPVNNSLFFDANDLTIDSVSIYSVEGKVILQQDKLNNNSIDVSSLSSGIYVVKFKSDDSTLTKKIVIE